MNIFKYLDGVSIQVNNPHVLYNLERLEKKQVKLESLQRQRKRTTSRTQANALDLAIAIYQRYLRSLEN